MRLQSLVSIFLILIGSCGLGFLFIKNHIASTGPISVFPKVVDIGEKKIGDLAVAEISIGNKGNAPLLISGIASSCGCMSIDFFINNEFKKLNTLKIPPLSSVKMRIQISVSGRPGFEQVVYAAFKTNEKSEKIKNIEIFIPRIYSAIWSDPLHLILNDVKIGDKFITNILFYNNHNQKMKIKKVKNSNPELFKVELDNINNYVFAKNHEFAGTLIGVIKVGGKITVSGKFSEFIEIITDDKEIETHKIEIYGKFMDKQN